MARSTILLSLLLASLAGCYLPAPADEGGGDTGGGDTGGGDTGGGDTGGGNTGGGNTGGGNTGGGAYYCCLNGQFFGCATEAAVDACFLSFDPSGCAADAAQNAACDDGGGNTGGGNTGGGNTGGGNTGGSIGDSCQYNDDCASRTCVVDGGADYGVCSDRCESFADCPTFWDCVELGNATGTYCVPG